MKKKKKNRSPSYGENSSYPTGVPPGSHPGYPVSYPVGTTAPPVHGLQQLHISDIGGQAAAGYPPGYGATSQPTGYYPQHQGQAGFTQVSTSTLPAFCAKSSVSDIVWLLILMYYITMVILLNTWICCFSFLQNHCNATSTDTRTIGIY